MARALSSEPTQKGYPPTCSVPVNEIGSSAKYLYSSGESANKMNICKATMTKTHATSIEMI